MSARADYFYCSDEFVGKGGRGTLNEDRAFLQANGNGSTRTVPIHRGLSHFDSEFG